MDKLNKIVLIGGGIIIALLLVIVFNGSSSSIGSVDRNSSYQSKNLTTVVSSSSLKSIPGTLGSVVLTATSAQTITLYDVSAVANWASTTLSTKIISLATGTPAGTYTFDLNFFKGLAVVAPVTPTVESIVTFR